MSPPRPPPTGRPADDSSITRDAIPEWIPAGTDPSLRASATDYLPLYRLRRSDSATPFADTANQPADSLADGKPGHVGQSNFTAAPGGEPWRSTC